jgi:hypothetical protein
MKECLGETTSKRSNFAFILAEPDCSKHHFLAGYIPNMHEREGTTVARAPSCLGLPQHAAQLEMIARNLSGIHSGVPHATDIDSRLQVVEGLVAQTILKQQPCILRMRPVLAGAEAAQGLAEQLLVLLLGGVPVALLHINLEPAWKCE